MQEASHKFHGFPRTKGAEDKALKVKKISTQSSQRTQRKTKTSEKDNFTQRHKDYKENNKKIWPQTFIEQDYINYSRGGT